MNNSIYIVEYLPADITLEEKEVIPYQVRQYEIIRETKDYIWVKKIDPRILPERNLPYKRRKKDFYKYGCFMTREDAIYRIFKIIRSATREAYEKYLRLEKMLNSIYVEMNISNITIKDV